MTNPIYLVSVVAPIILILGVIMLFINSQRVHKAPKEKKVVPTELKPINLVVRILALLTAGATFLPFINAIVLGEVSDRISAFFLFIDYFPEEMKDMAFLGFIFLGILIACILSIIIGSANRKGLTIACAIVNIALPLICYSILADAFDLGALLQLKPAFGLYCYVILNLAIIGMVLYPKFKKVYAILNTENNSEIANQ